MIRKRRTSSRTRTAKTVTPTPTMRSYLLKQWLLRILVPLGGHREFFERHWVASDEIASAIGLDSWLVSPDVSYSPGDALVILREAHQSAEAKQWAYRPPKALANNVAQIARLVGLNQVEVRILEFLVLLHNEQLLDAAAEYLGYLSDSKACHIIAVILGIPESRIRDALAPTSLLSKTGLVRIDRTAPFKLGLKLDLLGNGFAERMLSRNEDPISLFRSAFVTAPVAKLSLEDYPHVRSTLDIIVSHLRRANKIGRRSVNIFVHGSPGTGKSELARAIAAAIEVELYEVAIEGTDGTPLSGSKRLRAFSAAQCILTGQPALLVFDECEDVFGRDDEFSDKKGSAQNHKGWLNRSLEENRVPSIWLSNSVESVDPAFMRRFDIVLELDIPPKAQRRRIIESVCGDLVEQHAMGRLAESEHLAPAVIARAASVVRSIRDDLPDGQALPALEKLVESTLIAQGHRPLNMASPDEMTVAYDPAFINVDANLMAIAEGIAKTGSARLCMYGPPGTGKSAFGRWLADLMDKPLHVKRVSDIVSPYIGKTERNLAQAFHEADTEKAVLLLDEVDSFLQDRRRAQRSWEITAVNEMLVQMESFKGVFVASTNLMEGLDQAALRRFDLKLNFSYLKPAQAWQLLQRYAAALNLPEPGEDVEITLKRVSILTPGDFAAVARQAKFRPLEDAKAFVAALTEECKMKENSPRQAIGFM